jgi:hypothetical protein
LAVFGFLVSGFPNSTRDDDERLSLFTWFDSLGFDAVKGGEFVRVDTTETYDGKVQHLDPQYGFLVNGNAERFQVLTLWFETIRNPSGDSWEGMKRHFTYAPYDFAKWLKQAEKPSADSGAWASYSLNIPRLILISRACAARGLDNESVAWFKKAKVINDGYNHEGKSLKQMMSDELGDTLFGTFVAEFQDSLIPRTELADRFEWLARTLPDAPHAAAAKTVAADLRDQIRLRLSHKPPLLPLERLPVDTRIDELIYRLQDQQGWQMFTHGYPTIFGFDGPSGGNSTADQLFKLGLEAVPKLLDALHDKRFIRAYPVMMVYESALPIRVRDAAREILEQIAHRSFAGGSPYDVSALALQNQETRARKWWAEVQKVGERETLVRGVQLGDQASATEAEPLAKKYPTVALAAIKIGVRAAHEPYVREQLINALEHVDSRETHRFAFDQMRNGADLETRVSAARIVLSRSPKAAITSMIGEWRKLPPTTHFGEYGEDELRTFLLKLSGAEGVHGVSVGLSKQLVSRRADIVGDLSMVDFRSSYKTEINRKPYLTTRELDQYCRAAEDLLASLLLDKEARFGMSGGFNGTTFEDPRICDLAVSGLAQAWPKKYKFANSPSQSARDRQCFLALNTWRRSRGLATLQPAPNSAPAAVSAKVLASLLKEADRELPAERNATLDRIGRLGLGALPGVIKASEKAQRGTGMKAMLELLATRLSTTVTEVKVLNQSRGSGQLSRFVERWKNKPLSGQLVKELLRQVKAKWPKGAKGFTLIGGRDSDGHGIHISLDFGAPKPMGASGGDYVYDDRVTLNGETLQGEMGTSAADATEWSAFSEAVGKVVASKPLTPFDFHILIDYTPGGRRRQ